MENPSAHPPSAPAAAAEADPVLSRLRRDQKGLSIAGLAIAAAAVAVLERAADGPHAWLPFVAVLAASLPALLVTGTLALRLLSRASFEQGPAGARLDLLARLPGRLAGLHLAAWVGAGLGAGLLLLFLESFRPDRSFLLFLACILAGTATALAAFVRTAVHLMPLWAALDGSGDALAQVRRAPLRRRITLVFGGLVFFSSAFGLYTVFALQREIVGYYVEKQGNETAQAVEAVLAVAPDRPCETLAQLAPRDGTLLLRSPAFDCAAGRELPEALRGRLLASADGPLVVPSVDLEGIKYTPEGHPDAALVLLLQRPEWARRVLLVSLGFYTLLFLFSAFLAAQVARGLTTPVEALRKQLERIEQGNLQEPVRPGSADEIGQLALSADAMRRGLQEMVETIRALNLTLEEKVRDRTAALQETNEELRAAMARLKEAQAQLVHAEKMASLGRLMTGLAHELNNPVNAIRNSAGPLRKGLERLADGPDPGLAARLDKAARVVEHAAGRTVALIESMATFSRAGEQTRKEVDLHAAIDATLLLLQHRVEANGTTVRQHRAELPPVPCVPGELSQVLMNLLANALDAVAHLGADGRVDVTTRHEGEWVQVAVEDNGPGIPDADRARIFEPFFTTRDAGTGLGLAISDEVVRRHGGTLAVEAGTGGGARFVVTLPLVSPPLAPANHEANRAGP